MMPQIPDESMKVTASNNGIGSNSKEANTVPLQKNVIPVMQS